MKVKPCAFVELGVMPESSMPCQLQKLGISELTRAVQLYSINTEYLGTVKAAVVTCL
jgi:hypothetical protein